MRLTQWLRKQISRLEEELRESPVFESAHPATVLELADLRRKVVLHTYLKQQLLRREAVEADDFDYDTQEFELVLVEKPWE